MAFASVGAQIKSQLGDGPYCFRIHGQIYRLVSPLYPKGANEPEYEHHYIFDSVEATTKRLGNQSNQQCIATTGRDAATSLPICWVIYTSALNEIKYMDKQDVLGRTNWLLSLIRHGPHRKRRVQKFLYCSVYSSCRGNIFTEPLPSNDRGLHIYTDWWEGFMKYAVKMASGGMIYIPSWIKSVQVLKRCKGRQTYRHTQLDNLISLLLFIYF
jgi:hypothetical protein